MNTYARMLHQPQYTRTPRPVVTRKPRYTLHHLDFMRRGRTATSTLRPYQGRQMPYSEAVWWWLAIHRRKHVNPRPRCLFRRERERLDRELGSYGLDYRKKRMAIA